MRRPSSRTRPVHPQPIVLAVIACSVLASLIGSPTLHAQTAAVRSPACAAGDVAASVNQAAESLRRFNAENSPKLQARLRDLKARKGWSDAEYERRSIDLLHDKTIEDLDRRAGDILARIDALGVTGGGPVTAEDCSKVVQLQAASRELLATMKEKADHTMKRLDAQFAALPPAPERPKVTAPAEPALRPSVTASPPTAAQKAPRPNQKSTPASPAAPPPAWSSVTTPGATPPVPVGPPAGAGSLSADASPLPPLPPTAADSGYAIDEIREVSRGFFGTISTELGSVIEHAFRKSGRPTAYILGTEGGGAFLAGLRYGEGTLYLRSGGSQKIYWQGPSIGSDIGASGSRTMFLIYRADTPDRLYRRFTGVDGSAYFVGGVGMTFLTDGHVLMAPIRTGVGFRLGASIGYLRFLPRPTWNPF